MIEISEAELQAIAELLGQLERRTKVTMGMILILQDKIEEIARTR